MSNSAFLPLAAVLEMRQYWGIVEPLMEGTLAMRAAGQALLPKFPDEDPDVYKRRLNASTLLPAYSETVGNMTSRVFAQPMQLGDTVPDRIKEICTDADLSGCDINSWSVGFFREGLALGLTHAFVDYSATKRVRTMAEAKAAGARPYLVRVSPGQILGWRSKGGVLTMVRFTETVEEEEGLFGMTAIEQVRVLTPGRWEVYRKSENSKGEMVESLHDFGQTYLSQIPWVTFYTGRTGLMQARPPLMELAHQNIKHWQSQSDQDNIVHVIRVPILTRSGVQERFDNQGRVIPPTFKVGAGVLTDLPGNAKMEYVEHSGQAAEAGRTSLKDLIEEMRMSGAKMLQPQTTGNKTATQAEEESAQELSPLSRMAVEFADCIAQLLQWMATYMGLAEGGLVELRGNFEMDFMPETSLPTLLAMVNGGMLSKQTLFAEMQRRGIIADEYNWDEELEKISAQGPALGEV